MRRTLDWEFEMTPLSERWFGIVSDDEIFALSLGWFDLAFVRPSDFDRYGEPARTFTVAAALLAIAEWIRGVPSHVRA